MLVKLTTSTLNGDRPIYINPGQVVCVIEDGNGAAITTTANANGLHVIKVRETAETVHNKLGH